MIIQHTPAYIPSELGTKPKPQQALPVNGLSKRMYRHSLELRETFRNPPDQRGREGYLLFRLQTMEPRAKIETVEKLLWFLTPWLRGFLVWTYFSKTSDKVIARKLLINKTFQRAKAPERLNKVLEAAKSMRPPITIEELHEIGYGLPDVLAQELYKAYQRHLLDEKWKALGRKWGFSEAEVGRLISDEDPSPAKPSGRKKTAYEVAKQEFEVAAMGLPTKKRNDLYLTLVHLPFINRLRRAHVLADAKYHGIPEHIGKFVGKEIIEAGLIEAGPFSLYPLPDMLKEAGIPPILNLYIGCELAKAWCWRSKEWQVEAIRFGNGLGPIGFKREFTACQIAAFSPTPSAESVAEILEEAGIKGTEAEEVLSLFKQSAEPQKA